MRPELINLLTDLADVLEKHMGGLYYKTSDDGIYVSVDEDWENDVCIGWPMSGNVKEIRRIIGARQVMLEREQACRSTAKGLPSAGGDQSKVEKGN
jgi:hypothetical protein